MIIELILRLVSCLLAYICAWSGTQAICQRLNLAAYAHRAFRVEDVLRDQTLCFVVFASMGLVVSFAVTPWILAPCIGIAYILSRRAPSMLDARKAAELRSACDEQIDVMADIVAMGVRSGLSFDAAIGLYCSKFDNELAYALGQAQLEWKSGLASRQQALESLAARIGSKALKRFSDTSLQAIHYGSPLADMLGRFSSDIRQQRRNAIERQIAKAPVKLLIPTGTCILPAMLILVMGPVLLQFIQTGF